MTTNELIIKNMFLAERIARSKKEKLYHLSYEELKSAAYLGLVKAANKYKPEKNNCFDAYASLRIVGAIKDYLRELSWGTRNHRWKIVDFFEE